MFALIIAYSLTFPVLIGLLLIGLWAEWLDSTVSVFFGLMAAVVAFFMFDVDGWTLAAIAAGYFVVGILWSFYRYKRYVESVVAKVNRTTQSDSSKQIDMKYCEPSYNTNRIVAWILVWPLSVIENLTGDIVRMIKNLVTETLKSIYAKLHSSATSKLILTEGEPK